MKRYDFQRRATKQRPQIVEWLQGQLRDDAKEREGRRIAAGLYVPRRCFKTLTAHRKLMAFRRGLREKRSR